MKPFQCGEGMSERVGEVNSAMKRNTMRERNKKAERNVMYKEQLEVTLKILDN